MRIFLEEFNYLKKKTKYSPKISLRIGLKNSLQTIKGNMNKSFLRKAFIDKKDIRSVTKF